MISFELKMVLSRSGGQRTGLRKEPSDEKANHTNGRGDVFRIVGLERFRDRPPHRNQ